MNAEIFFSAVAYAACSWWDLLWTVQKKYFKCEYSYERFGALLLTALHLKWYLSYISSLNLVIGEIISLAKRGMCRFGCLILELRKHVELEDRNQYVQEHF